MTTKITGSNITNIDGVTIKDGGVTWNAVTVADGSTTLSASAGNGYFLDTNTGVIEVFLPTSPSRGDTIVVADYAGTFATNNVIINTGSNNLDSTTTRQYKLATNDTTAEFIYVDSAKGWITRILQAAGTTPDSVFTSGVYDTDAAFIAATGGTIATSGDFKIHTFTGDANFVISSGQGSLSKVDYLVVAGGGGGTYGNGGGGGAGGFRESHSAPVSGTYTASPLASSTPLGPFSPGTYPVTVGAGGSGAGPGPQRPASTSGSNSVFSTITSTGGGRGGSENDIVGAPGGSGGGAPGNNSPTPGSTGGSGNTPPVSPPQGANGGNGSGSNGPLYGSGGGGGAIQAGTNGSSNSTGVGGAGAGTLISATDGLSNPPDGLRYYAGGGGANIRPPGSGTPQGGLGGGGNGGGQSASQAGAANSGGGGGGGEPSPSSAGGKGVVIIRYKFQ